MENASKALIIAGAILLSILIIGLGMVVYNNSNSTVGKSNMSAEEVNAFNSQFESYEGNQKGSNVRALINKINSSNKAEATTGDSRTITFTEGSVNSAGDIKTNRTYTVKFTYHGEDDENAGCIDTVEITTQGAD